MKKILAPTLSLLLFVTMCDIPAFSQPTSEYEIYNDYRNSLITLQQDVAQLYLELQQKNPQAVYQHILQITEDTAALIGNAEIASHNVYKGFQGSLQGHLELFFQYGLSEKQKKELLDLGYTEKDIAEIMKSLAYYNDYYYHAVEEFTPEQVQWFYSMGLTDTQIIELQTKIRDHYTQIHTLEEEIKQHQIELLYVQFSLSIAALKMLLDQENTDKKSDNLKKAEEKLLKAIKNVSDDRSSLEHVKAFSKQVYKAAEQKIRNGESQYMVDFFVGLQIHCGAVTALHGDTAFGLTEIKSYEGILSECISNIESILLHGQNEPVTEQLQSPDASVTDFVGQVKESNEDNNSGYIIVVVKTWGTRISDIAQMMAEWGIPEVVRHLFLKFLRKVIGLAIGAAKFVVGVVAIIYTLITTAPPAGGSWVECAVDCMTEDPSGIFAEIYEDKNTVATIEEGTQSGKQCERFGYRAVYTDPIQIVYTIMHAIKVYKSPDNRYYYYRKDNKDEWVVEVDVLEHECCGRVAAAYRVDCDYECGDTILEKWELCDNFTLVWERSESSMVWVKSSAHLFPSRCYPKLPVIFHLNIFIA